MHRQVFKILPLFTLILLLVRCAQVAPLTGGPRDTTAPQLREAIPANQSTNFSSDVILLSFDEFVQVGDVANQLIVSPKLSQDPQIVAEGKRVRITLDKTTLRPNTTYRFYLGQAISDITEGNTTRNFEYIFSTGAYIDSLQLSGQVTEAFSNGPAEAVVALYDNVPGDSLPYKQTPDYISRTDANGNFTFSNLPYRDFKVYAFGDKNKNNLYDGEVEKIAFRDAVLRLGSDSSMKLKLFREEPPKYFIKKIMSPYYGLTTVILSKRMQTIVKPLSPQKSITIYETNPGLQKDTISVYYRDIPDTLKLLLENAATAQSDTLLIPVPKQNKLKRKIGNVTTNMTGNVLPFGKRLHLIFPNWMDTSKTDLSQLRLKEPKDSTKGPEKAEGYWVNATVFGIRNNLAEGKDYVLQADTNAFRDVHGLISDSLKITFKTQSRTELGKLHLKMLFGQKQDYIVQLLDEKDNLIAEQKVQLSLSSSNLQSLEFADLTPAGYKVKVIADDNSNGKWDTGHLILKRQPEQVFVHPKQLKVLSDWEIEEQIEVKLQSTE